jgi:hypothetical protein
MQDLSYSQGGFSNPLLASLKVELRRGMILFVLKMILAASRVDKKTRDPIGLYCRNPIGDLDQVVAIGMRSGGVGL